MTEDHTVTPLDRLGGRWVIVLPGGRLWSWGEAVDIDDDPELFRTAEEAHRQLEQCRAEAANIGLTGWNATVCRLRDVGAIAPVMAPESGVADVAGLNHSHPGPAPDYRYEYAVLTPSGPYRDHDEDEDLDIEGFTVYDARGAAEARARDIIDWSTGLGVEDYRAIVVRRSVESTTGPWERA